MRSMPPACAWQAAGVGRSHPASTADQRVRQPRVRHRPATPACSRPPKPRGNPLRHLGCACTAGRHHRHLQAAEALKLLTGAGIPADRPAADAGRADHGLDHAAHAARRSLPGVLSPASLARLTNGLGLILLHAPFHVAQDAVQPVDSCSVVSFSRKALHHQRQAQRAGVRAAPRRPPVRAASGPALASSRRSSSSWPALRCGPGQQQVARVVFAEHFERTGRWTPAPGAGSWARRGSRLNTSPATRAISRKRRCASSVEFSEASTSCSRSGC
jgi:hypothetical protein